MRNTKEITISDKKIEVGEIRVKEVWNLFDEANQDSMVGRFDQLLNSCSNLKRDDFLEMYPSEIEELVEVFKEVNTPFLRLAKMVRLDKAAANLLTEISDAIAADLSEVFVNLPGPDTAGASGNMDGDIS